MLGAWISAGPPGEFEQQAALLLGLNSLVDLCPRLLVDVVAALIERIPLLAAVRSEAERQQVMALLCDWGVPAHLLHFVFLPVKGIWVRDYGPTFARRSDGAPVIIDAEYPLHSRRNDDLVPTALANLLRLPVARIPFIADGGLLVGNGQGLCVTTTALLAHNERRGYSQDAIQRFLEDFYGYPLVAVLMPLYPEKTGHVDMFATFTAADTLVLGSYSPSADAANARILDENARLLAGTTTRSGPLKVVRIPMPRNTDGIFRTYTNVIYANGTLLVPSYPDQDPGLEKDAMEVYTRLLPDWHIVPIDCSEVIRRDGALRCMSVSIPWLTDRFSPPPARAAPSSQRGCGVNHIG